MTQAEQNKLQAILKTIKKADKIIIHRHVRPDPDAIGSQVGLAEILRANFPDKTVLTAGSGTDHLKFLADFSGVQAKDYDGALVIVTDTANIDRIDGGEHIDFDQNQVIKIDHHPLDDPYGNPAWVKPSASSCSEMIADFYFAFEDSLTLPDNAARLLYGGIVGDTGRFEFPATTPHTMQVAGRLMESNFDHTDLLNQLYEVSPQVASLNGYVLDQVKVEDGVGAVVIDQAKLQELGLTDADTNAIVNVPRPIAGVLCWGIFVEQTDGSYRCRLRSKGPAINQIAKDHGGGGHPMASGAYAYSKEEIQVMIDQFKQAVKDFQP